MDGLVSTEPAREGQAWQITGSAPGLPDQPDSYTELTRRHAPLRRRHADRQPRGPDVPGAANAPGGGPHRRRGHAADGEAARPLRDPRPLVSLREHNEVRETPRLIARLGRGESIALVSDAGTPGISDPGARLVRAARERGPSSGAHSRAQRDRGRASVSGFQATSSCFWGFLRQQVGEARKEWFRRLAEERETARFSSRHPTVSGEPWTDAEHYLVNRPIIVWPEN